MQKLALEDYEVQELSQNEKIDASGGFRFFKLTVNGLLDGIPNNTEVHLEIFGFDIF